MKLKLILLFAMLVGSAGLTRAGVARSLTSVYTVCPLGCDFVTIQAAENAATSGDAIQILAAVHTEAGISLTKDLTISGQGVAATIVQADTDPGVALDRIFWVQAGANVVIRDMTLRNGNVDGWGGALRNTGTLTGENLRLVANTAAVGGGAVVNEGALTLRQTVIQDNSAVQFGGGVYNWTGAVLRLADSSIQANVSDNGGGLLNNLDAQTIITATTFSANTATTNGGGALNGGVLTVSESTFTGNIADSRGGGLGNFGANSVSTVNTSLVSANTANGGGGGLDNVSGTLILNQVTVNGNSADQGGGLSNGDNLVVNNSTFAGNIGFSIGGGLFNGGDGVISQSTFNNNNAPYAGAVINNSSAHLLTEDSQFNNNTAANDGGAVLNGGELTFNRCVFSGNSAIGGGAINNGTGTMIINDSRFQNNLAVLNGGAVENFIGLLTVNNTVFQNNTVSAVGVSGGFGGAIYNSQGTVTIDLSSFTGNQARSTASGNGWGGAVFNQAGVLSLDHSTLVSNSATTFGGGVLNGGVFTLQNSTLVGNIAIVYGGGIANLKIAPGSGTLQAQNVTLTGNIATRGGGAFNAALGTLTVDNSTFYDNLTTSNGTEFLNAVGSLIVRNSIAANDTNDNACDGVIDSAGAPNLASDISCNFSLRADPLLGPLLDNGGPTPTRALLPGSPALDAGDDTTCLPTDQRGISRPRGEACDLGAYEALAYPAVSFSSAAYSVPEAAGTWLITVTLTHSTEEVVTVPYGAEGGSATPGSDYQVVGGTLTFLPGETLRVLQLIIVDDALNETDETINLALSEPANATLGDPSETVVTILDDDPIPAVHLDAAAYTVGESGAVITATVVMSAPSGKNVSVQYQTAPGTATIGSDYLSAGGVLNFAPGQVEQAVAMTILDDALDENDETFSLSLINPVNVLLGSPAEAVITIADDDAPPAIALASADFAAVENTGSAIITVTLSMSSTLPVSVDYATSDGTATGNEDYTPVSGTLTLLPGAAAQTFSIPLLDDLVEEAAETVLIALSNPINATLGNPVTATLTIENDDTVRHLNFSNAAYLVNEVAGAVTLQVVLDLPTNQTVTVAYTTSDLTAKAGQDYVAKSGTLTFAPGQTSQPLTITLLNDLLDEPSEAFSVMLSNPVNAQLGDTSGAAVYILDDDPPRFYRYVPISFRQ